MVQRKAPDKLGIQAATRNLNEKNKSHPVIKLSSSQNSGYELKKIMKKSRSIKRSDLESTPKRRTKPLSTDTTNKSPPTDVPVSAPASTPKKPALVKLPETSPNFMKSTSVKLRDASPNHMKPTPVKLPDSSPNYMKSTTSSSNARKERSQVSPQRSKTSSVSKSPCLKDSKYPKQVCDSSHKPLKTLTKKSSLKPVRTITKTSSNKAGRPSSSMKKKSGVPVYPDPNVERATCSSTLKDSKFPPYVTLHPGGTESEGTSVMKVCPYTYCSLNGHHHAQLPPLKHFLRARRRSIKNQKSMKLKNQSPVRVKCRNERKEGINTGQLVLNGDHPAVLETEEVGDYFVEIYAQSRQDTNDADDAIDEADDGRNAENLTDNSLHPVISIDDNSNHYSDFMMTEMDISMIYTEQSSSQEDDADLGGYAIGSESKAVSPAESEADELMFEDMVMDWEDGAVVDSDLVYAKLEEKPDEDVFEEPTTAPEETYGVSESENDFVQDENSACSINVQWGTQMKEQDHYSSPEYETEEDDIYSEDPDVAADAGCDELQLKGQHANGEDGALEATEENEDQSEGSSLNLSTSTYTEGDSDDSEWNKSKSGEASNAGDENIHLKHIEIDATETCIAITDVAGAEEKTIITNAGFDFDQDISENQSNQYRRTMCKRPVDDVEEPREFNPRGPNFLPVEPDQDAEKVDLRHQMMDERKNAEEWMLDYALQQTVNKLAPARKKKVSLLVEAFEAVIPVPKYKSLHRTASSFTQPRFLQACS